MKAVEVHQNGKPGPVLALSGSVNQLFFSQLVEGKVDTRQLHAREVYVRNAHKTDLELAYQKTHKPLIHRAASG